MGPPEPSSRANTGIILLGLAVIVAGAAGYYRGTLFFYIAGASFVLGGMTYELSSRLGGSRRVHLTVLVLMNAVPGFSGVVLGVAGSNQLSLLVGAFLLVIAFKTLVDVWLSVDSWTWTTAFLVGAILYAFVIGEMVGTVFLLASALISGRNAWRERNTTA